MNGVRFWGKMLGRTISHYKIVEKLGEVGMPVSLRQSESGSCGL